MLFKMLGIERAYVMRKDSMPKPRQIFVTQSRVLASKVEEYFSKLLDSLSTAERTREELAQFVKNKRQENEDGLIDIDDDQTWRSDLPSKFSRLRDENFPLFLTFDRVSTCKIIFILLFLNTILVNIDAGGGSLSDPT